MNILSNKKIRCLTITIVLSLITFIIYNILKTPNVLFFTNIVMLILILIKAKFSYFSMKTLVINYILFAVFFQYNTGESYGILEVSTIELNYFLINFLILLYNIISYIWICCLNVLINEKELLNDNFEIGKLSTYFCCLLAIVTAIIAFPGMPFNENYVSNRFVGLLQGNAWNHISIVCLLFVLPNFKKNHFVKFTYLFVIFWFISHYERVDIIGLLFFCFVYILARKKKIKLKTYIIFGIIALVCVFTMVYMGEKRAGNEEYVNISSIIRKTLVQNTASDIGYVFNTSIDFYKNEDLLLGKSYITYIIKLLPFTDSDVRVGNILNEKYNTPGGEFILSEPLMNFGIIGVIVFQIIEYSIYTLILSKKNKYRFFLYSFLMMTVFRTCWYGWIYIEKAVVYFIPVIYIITKYLDEFEKKRISYKDEIDTEKEDDEEEIIEEINEEKNIENTNININKNN